MSGALQAVLMNQRSFGPIPSQQAYVTAGTYTWVVPSLVTNVSVVAVGGGGTSAGTSVNRSPGSGGGELSYYNNISVTPAESLTVVVGNTSGQSSLKRGASVLISANGGASKTGVCYTGGAGGSGGTKQGGGNGGAGGSAMGTGQGCGGGGGGAGGYAGCGGAGALYNTNCFYGYNGTGGGAGGGGTRPAGGLGGGAGGGVGILGQGANGTGGFYNGSSGLGGGGGSGGAAGTANITANSNVGGAYGGGTGGVGSCFCQPKTMSSGKGAVRIIWPGSTRTFPSTCTGDK